MESLVFGSGNIYECSVGFLAAPVIRRRFILGFILGLGVGGEDWRLRPGLTYNKFSSPARMMAWARLLTSSFW